MSREQNVRTEEFRVSGAELVDMVKELVHQGNVRRLIIRNEAGKSVLDMSLTVGVVGAVLVAPLAAIVAIGALATRHTILVERIADEGGAPPVTGEPSPAGRPATADPEPAGSDVPPDMPPEPGTVVG